MINVQLSVSESCHDCHMFEPKMDYNQLYGNNALIMTDVVICCANEKLCAKLREELSRKNYTDSNRERS